MNHYLFALLFFLPAGVANATPPVANIIPLLNRWKTPIDSGKKVNGKPMFGKNKTWRGLVVGTLAGGLTGLLLFPAIGSIGASEGNLLAHFLIGCSLGLGALLGDVIESFFKRQKGIKSGTGWLGFDQLDYVVGAIVLSLPFIRFTLTEYLAVLATYFIMHFVASYIGFLLGIKEDPFKF